MSAEDFDFDFTLEQVEDMLKGNSEAEEWYDAMCHVLPQYGCPVIGKNGGIGLTNPPSISIA